MKSLQRVIAAGFLALAGCGGAAEAGRPATSPGAEGPADQSVVAAEAAPPREAMDVERGSGGETLDLRKVTPGRARYLKQPAQPPAPPGAGNASGRAQTEATAPHEANMLIYTAHLTLAVFQVDRGLAEVEQLARSLGGYLATRTDVEITIRIPRGRFEEAVARIEKQGDVLHREVAAQDVTDEYVDLEVRLKNARAMRDRLQELLKNASTKDALEIEKELRRVTEEIERMEGRLKLLADKIAYSTITVSFQPIDQNPVHDLARLPFPWLSGLGLSGLLNVHE